MDDVVGTVEEGRVRLRTEDVCALPGDFMSPWGRGFGGRDCVPGWFTGAAGGDVRDSYQLEMGERARVPEGDDVPATGDGVFAYSGA